MVADKSDYNAIIALISQNMNIPILKKMVNVGRSRASIGPI